MKHLILILSIGFLSDFSTAETCNSISSGQWTNPVTWSCGVVPSPGDSIHISAGDHVFINSDLDYSSSITKISIDGSLMFHTPQAILRMSCGSVVYINEDGLIRTFGIGGKEHRITICGIDEWDGNNGDIDGPETLPPSGLPVELIYIEAVNESNTIVLTFATASEINSDYFLIEGSSDGIDWRIIGEIDGQGTTNERSDYLFEYDNTFSRYIYFRVKQVDFDGQYEYFKVVSVQLEGGIDFNVSQTP